MTRIALGLLLGLLAACQAEPAKSPAAAAVPNGRWVTASGNLEVEIAPCGPALCGTVTKVLADHSMSPGGGDMGDKPALGLQIMKDFAPDGDGGWAGEIYNRENGKTYSCLMSVIARDELQIRPYVGLPLFGQTQIWRRTASADAPK